MQGLESSDECLAEYEGMYTSSTQVCELNGAMAEIAESKASSINRVQMFTLWQVPVVCFFSIIHMMALSAESAEIGQMLARQLQVSVRFSRSGVRCGRFKE